MPRSVEIDHYSHMLASLTVSAVRASGPEVLREVHNELVQAYGEIFALIAHDAKPPVLEMEPKQ